jgi:hypothetical protein
MVGRATLTMVVSMMDMNMAATKTTLTATFSLTNPVVRGLPDSRRPATSARVSMTSFLDPAAEQVSPAWPPSV